VKREAPKPTPVELLREIMRNQERKKPDLAAKQRRLLDILAARKRSVS